MTQSNTTQTNLNRKLVLEAPRSLHDGAGGYRVIWRELGTVWADIRSASGTEALVGEVPRSRVHHQITIRAAPPGSEQRPQVRQRFREGARIYRIVSVIDHDQKGRFLRCIVEEEQMI